MRGRVVPEPPLRGGHGTQRRRASSRVAPTEAGMDSRPRLHGGRLCAGETEGGMGPRMREDTGGGDFTPILTFPPEGGREREEGE